MLQQNPEIQRIEDVPVIAINVKILKTVSLLIDNTWHQYIPMLSLFLLNLWQIAELFHNIDSPAINIREIYVIILAANTYLRAILLSWQRENLEKFFQYLKELYVDLQNTPDHAIRKMLEKCSEKTQILSKINLILGAFTVLGFTVAPLFAHKRELVFSVYVPIVDKYQSPWYQIIYISHVLLLPNGLLIHVPFTSLMVSCMIFGILMCQVLQYRLRSLQKTTEMATSELIWCIKYQLRIIRFVDHFNSLNSGIFMIELMMYGGMICVLLYSMVVVHTFMEIFIVLAYLSMVLCQVFFMYYFANALYEESLQVAIAAYDSEWLNFDVKTQKMLQLLILRAQKSCSIHIGKVYPMNLSTMLALLKYTYSFFALLKRFYG